MEPPMWFQMLFWSVMILLIFTLTVGMWVAGVREFMDHKNKSKR